MLSGLLQYVICFFWWGGGFHRDVLYFGGAAKGGQCSEDIAMNDNGHRSYAIADDNVLDTRQPFRFSAALPDPQS